MVAVLTDKKTSLHKHKMGARDSMLYSLVLVLLIGLLCIERPIQKLMPENCHFSVKSGSFHLETL